jgi:hypothetical protein
MTRGHHLRSDPAGGLVTANGFGTPVLTVHEGRIVALRDCGDREGTMAVVAIDSKEDHGGA